MAEARAALSDQAASSDQKLGVLSQENQQQVSLLRQEAEQQRLHFQGQMAAVQQENFTLKENLQQAKRELDSLQFQLKAGHEAWQSSQGVAAELQKGLAEEESQKQLLHHELQNAKG